MYVVQIVKDSEANSDFWYWAKLQKCYWINVKIKYPLKKEEENNGHAYSTYLHRRKRV